LIFFSASPEKSQRNPIWLTMAGQITSDLPKIQAEGSIKVHHLLLNEGYSLNKTVNISKIV